MFRQILGWVIVLLHESATIHPETRSEPPKLSKVHHPVKQATDPGLYWWLSQQSWRLCCCFFFFLLPIRLSSTRTRSTLAPCPPTLSVTSLRGSWMSTRTRWRGNNKARKVCLTVDTRGAEPRPQLGLGFICLALFSLFVLFSCPEGGVNHWPVCHFMVHIRRVIPIFKIIKVVKSCMISPMGISDELIFSGALKWPRVYMFGWPWPCVLNQVFFRMNV